MPKKFKESVAFSVGCKMPPLPHNKLPPEKFFDILQSEAAQWLVDQPEIRRYLFSKMSSSGAIIYDPETGTWCGRDTA